MSTITVEQVKTLAELFRRRVEQTPDKVAYRHFSAAGGNWVDTTWRQMGHEVSRWQKAIRASGLVKGDRVAVMLRNSREWVLFDQAALGLGLVTVPLYVEDRADNAAYILRNAGVKLLLVEGREQWQSLMAVEDGLATVQHIISLDNIEASWQQGDPRLHSLSEWLFAVDGGDLQTEALTADDLASIVYTSGTTGNPKGVMLSHQNMLYNAWVSSRSVGIDDGEIFLSFLPLSHTLERTIGYYLAMMIGAMVAFNRSIKQLPDDLVAVRPTVLISVPRIYERVYERILTNIQAQSWLKRALFRLAVHVGWQRFRRIQGRIFWRPELLLWPLLNALVAQKVMSRLGGRIKIAVCGGAPLPPPVARLFISMGLTLLQGYGLTEASPVISVNRQMRNKPESIGLPLPDIEVRISDEGELQTRSACVMQGYWDDEAATRAAFTADGWLKTGDKASVDEEGYLYITGRLKDILVLSNGEKVPPADMEMAISMDPLFDQVMVIGEGRPYLTALIVLNAEVWRDVVQEYRVDAGDPSILARQDINDRVLERVASTLKRFPGYAQIRAVHATLEPWTVESGLLTPTLKIKRNRLMERYATEIESLYRRE